MGCVRCSTAALRTIRQDMPGLEACVDRPKRCTYPDLAEVRNPPAEILIRINKDV